jgi:Tfp pilus assembly protein PilN
MLNLLPRESQKLLNSRYRGRLVMLWLIVLLITFLMSAASLLPTLVNIGAQEQALLAETAFLKSVLERYRLESQSRTVDQATGIFEQAAFDRTGHNFSTVLEGVLRHDTDALDMSRFNFVQHAGQFTLEVEGIAKGREDLVFFIDALKRDRMFDNASVPISQFAKDKDLTFTMSVMGAENISPE